nr:MAG TPA: distal tail protein [Caudoviricetes sp.]
MNYILWNNKDSRDINGLLISELPPITKPGMRVRETVIDGVDGSIIEEFGYESYDKSVTVGLKIGADVDKVIEFFTGSGEVVFSNEPDKYYIARIIKNIDFSRLLRYRVAKVTFRVQPFKFRRAEVTREVTSENRSLVIRNDGNYVARPIITITGSGTIKLFLNNRQVCQYTFPEDDNVVVLDSEKQDAYVGNILKNRNMTGEFPVFEKGINAITWSGTVESIRVSKYSRWL